MNKNLLTLLISFTLFSLSANAQSYNKKFGLEVNGGLREYHGDLGSALYFKASPDYQAVGGAFGMYLNKSFDFNVYGSVGDLGFYKQSYDTVRAEMYRQGFRARITEVMLGVTFKLNNGSIIKEDARFKPYLRAGWGAMQSISKFTPGSVPEGYTQSRTWISSQWNAGLGVKIKLSESFDLNISEQFNYAFDDNYDASPYTIAGAKLNSAQEGNKPLHDVYAYHNIGLVFNFGGNGNAGYTIKDSDNDGISDKFDICPKTPEGYEVDTVGCPYDDDKDGIVNEEDKCPNIPGTIEFNGCPDTDGDGIMDSEDKCPKKAGSKEGEGCPDSDGDGLYDHLDKCPFSAGDKDNDGCPKDDKDRDGIADTDDKCPDVPGLKEFAGCPDSDKDGIQDSEDKCPLKPGSKEGEGCPDSDGDGIFDHLDVCPATPGVAGNKGCPEIKEEVKEQIRLAAKGIYFESGNDVIKAESFSNLDQLATIMDEYKEAKVMIEGHTDSQGADAANMTLSQKRADAVKMYIASKGVTEIRMTAIGYGETKPVADNGSAEGRALNRRVDFKLVY